jgi:hypothetical protein
MAVFVCAVSFNTLGQTDMRHMRGAHATSNYGANVAGFGKPALSLPETITADRVAVQISRSISEFGTWDLAAVDIVPQDAKIFSSSALDAESERMVQTALELFGGCGSLTKVWNKRSGKHERKKSVTNANYS